MERPRPQELLVRTAAVLAGAVAVGAILDAWSNARQLITPAITYAASAAAGLLIGLWWSLTSREWRVHGQLTRITRIGPLTWCLIGGAIALLWMPRLADQVDLIRARRAQHQSTPAVEFRELPR